MNCTSLFCVNFKGYKQQEDIWSGHCRTHRQEVSGKFGHIVKLQGKDALQSVTMDPSEAAFQSGTPTFLPNQYTNPGYEYYPQEPQQALVYYSQDPMYGDYSQGMTFYASANNQACAVPQQWPEGAVQQTGMPQQFQHFEQCGQPRSGRERRGRGGRARGGRSSGSGGRPRQEFEEFQRRFQQNQVDTDKPVESSRPEIDDHKVEEERTFTEVIGVQDGGRMHPESGGNIQTFTGYTRQRGTRPKQRGQQRGAYSSRTYETNPGSYYTKQYQHEAGNHNYQNTNTTRRNNYSGRPEQRGRQGRSSGTDRNYGNKGQRGEYGNHQSYGSKSHGSDSDRVVTPESEFSAEAQDGETSQIDKPQNKKMTKNLKIRELQRNGSNSSNDWNKGQRAPPRVKGKMQSHVNLKDGDQETQRGALIEQLSTNGYECMVCCEIVRCDAPVWSCGNCFHVFHLRCVKRWARSPAAIVEGESGGWRCPACQNVSQQFPHHYTCFCGKVKDPGWNRFEIPHSCGEVCNRKRGPQCSHLCNTLCHPGPCPPCHASVVKACDCGKTKQTVKCGQTAPKCDEICEKTLNCGKHDCKAVCHEGSCEPCSMIIHQACYCNKVKRDVTCGTAESFTTLFSCTQTCNRLLPCGNHKCDKRCHPGSCDPCKLLPSAVTHCACGKRHLEELEGNIQRNSCTDPVPTCDSICGKILKCGPKDKRHKCQKLCHDGECQPCEEGVTPVPCRCGILERDVSCEEAVVFTPQNPMLCDKRCNKKRICNRHKCPNLCCVDQDHPCDLLCGGKLSCGLHRCEEPCHRGNCPTCWQVSFEELHCHCGAEVIYPPVPCGTQPPTCMRSCKQSHPCDHEVRHNCHSEEKCPPCTELTEKWCMGRHELRRNIACHLTDISCGLPCGKQLLCGRHKCRLICHKGECMKEGEVCQQTCVVPREECGHPCGLRCHGDAPCKKTPCQMQIVIKCNCGNRTERALCLLGSPANTQDYQKVAVMVMASKMADVQSGQSFDISTLTSSEATKKRLRQLECNKECDRLERNKRLALALEIKNPDIQGKLGSPTYSLFLRDFARQNLAFVTNVEKELTDLVFSAQKSKKPKRSHAFPPMNNAQRRLVHELAPQFGCETLSYDQEPKKNVVATAYKDRCWQPSVGLSTIIQRELHPKAPTPIPHHSSEQDFRTSLESSTKGIKVLSPWGRTTAASKQPGPAPSSGQLQASGSWASYAKRSTPSTEQAESKPKPPEIDYFDMTD